MDIGQMISGMEKVFLKIKRLINLFGDIIEMVKGSKHNKSVMTKMDIVSMHSRTKNIHRSKRNHGSTNFHRNRIKLNLR